MTTKLELVTANSTDTLMKLKKGQADAAVAWAGLNPAATIPRGRGVTNLYDRAELEKAVHDMLEAQKPVAKQTQPPADLAPIADVLSTLLDVTTQTGAQMLTLSTRIQALSEQLITVQKQVNSFDDRTLDAINALGTLVDNRTTCLLHAVNEGAGSIGLDPDKYIDLPLTRDAVEPEVVLPKVVGRKLKVGIVGLLGGQKQIIMKDFADALDLKFFETTKSKTKQFESGVSQCDVAIGMVNFINHGVEPVIRNAGVPYIQVRGGMSTLKDKLTEMFVGADEKVAA